MKFGTMFGIALGVLAAGVATAGDLAVSAYWQDHMVLQRGKPITVWGKDVAGRAVTVSFAGQTANATTGADGFWETTFAQPFAVSAAAQTLTITDDANESITLSDVLVGDVFLAGGQSNMDRRLDYNDFHEPQSVKDFCRDDDGIRFLRIARSAEGATEEKLFDLPPIKPVDDTVKYYGEGHDWSPATGDARYCVSSVALNFAHYLRRANAEKGEDIPIGIVHASSGGTAIREWLAPSVLSANGYQTYGSTGSSDGWFWNNMMAPILRAKFRAILWYQGCSDGQREADDYKALMDVLVKDRRDRWGEDGDLPFYAVQIGTAGYYGPNLDSIDHYPAPTEDPYESNYVRIREAQRLWDRSDKGTHGLVTIVDCVKCLSAGDLHPTDKNFVGRRLSLLARRDLYGEADLQAEGPVFTRAVREADGSVRIFFKPGTSQGLTAGRMKPASDVELSRWVKKGSDPIRGFALCGADGVWQEAVATVEGETVVLRAEGVSSPTTFHYGYWSTTRETELEDGQRLNLYNGAGLPMSPVAPQAVEDPDASPKVADPVLTPGSCYFSPSTNVTIACATSGATVRYTLDGTEPTATSAAYAAPIALSATTTVRARAFAENKDPSDIASATYTLGEPPAPEPDPQWTNGAYEPSAWAPLGENLLAGATASYSGNLSYIGSKDMAKLTDGRIPVDITGDTGAGSQTEVVGFQEDSAAVWTFAEPTTIGKIRISTRWATTSFDAITVKDVYVLQGDDWVALGVPDSHRTGVASITTGSLEATLEDDALGYLAQNVSGLKIVFGAPESAVANYYAEIEAIAPGGEIPPAETVATPAFDPAACSFYPTTNVTLSCATADATIRYTLDGSAPTSSSAVYTAPIALAATTTVKARAYAEGMNPSAVATATYACVEPPRPGAAWTTGAGAPADWTPLANNLLAGLGGTIGGATAGFAYGTNEAHVVTDASVPAQGGADYIVGFQNNASITWTFSEPATLDRVRISCGYLKQTGYSGATVSAIEVRTSGSTDWTAVSTEAGQLRDTGKAEILTLVLADGSGEPLAEDVDALRVTFGAPPVGFANYCAEIEAAGRAGIEPTTYDIAIAAPQNGTLETSATNNVAAGTVVTVFATPAAGYRLASVTTNGAALAGTTFEMPSEAVTLAATFEEEVVPPPGDKMFYIGETGYDSWTNAYQAAKAGDTITLGRDAVIDPPVIAGVFNKSLTIDLNGHELTIVECWLTGCTVAVVDTGAPAGSGRFKPVSSGVNISGGTLDLSALSDEQVAGYFQMSSTSLLKFPHNRSAAYSTSHLWFDPADPAHGVGARIVVRGLTYEWDGVSWGIAFTITSIAVDDEFVELGVLVAPEYGVNPNVTILGCETVNGQFHARPDATTADGALYRLPVSDDRFFQAVLGMPD